MLKKIFPPKYRVQCGKAKHFKRILDIFRYLIKIGAQVPKKQYSVIYIIEVTRKHWKINVERNTVLKNLGLFTNEGPCSFFFS